MPVPDHLKIVVSNLPETSGIYKFYDEKQRLLYIGKSKNLKNRVRTYFRKQSNETHDRTLMMIFHINEIQIEQTDTGLEALILEDNLIKQYLPPYNVKQKKFKEQVYIAVTIDLFPAFRIAANDEVDYTEKIFGPFKDKYAAEHILHVIQKVLKLRKCIDPTPTNKCMLTGIGKCLGPCKGDLSETKYKKSVDIALNFLNGDVELISDKINVTIEEAAKNLDFEEAAKFRDLQDYCQNFAKRQKFMYDFMNDIVLINSASGKHHFLFQKGQLLKVYKRLPKQDKLLKILSLKVTQKILPASHLMDRAYVAWVWVKQNDGEYISLNIQ
jgi:excinuclease ABC subunit C